MSESDFMARLRTTEIPQGMPISAAIRDFLVAHPPGPDQSPEVMYELIQLLTLSLMRMEGRVALLEGRSELTSEFLKTVAEIFPKEG